MDAQIIALDDHCQIQIFVQVLGRKHTDSFNRILERLRKIDALEVSEDSRRFIRPCFITSINKDLIKFGELQAHRKVFGFLGVACVPTLKGEADAMAALGASRASFDSIKEDYSAMLLNSKCLTFGMPELAKTFFNSTDLLTFESIEESPDFEEQIHEFIRSIYFILESKRMDTSFESSEQLVCPILTDEERYLIGTNKSKPSKTYRKKCLGRLRKQTADYAMLSGVPSIALELYHSAIEQLKGAGDLLWLAAAYEGWSIATFLTQKQKLIINEKPDDPYKKIMSKLKSALENYERFSFVAFVEFECVVKMALVYKEQNMLSDTEYFLRDHVGKYLDDDFNFFNNLVKAQICMISAEIFKSIGFIRKYAFYARLAVLFRLHVNDSDQKKTEADYRIVYPVLYSTLPGYGIQINDSSHYFTSSKGHVSIQVKTLHEVFMSAQRAGYIDAAIRHLCYILQVYFFHIDDANKLQLIDELKRLVRLQLKKSDRISLVQPLALENSSVILPPIQMTRFPSITNFRIQPLPPNVAPNILPPDDQAANDVFIYSPFQDRDRVKKTLWVVDTVCQVNVQVQNLLPTELVVHSLVLHTEGCDFEAVPVRLNLAAASSHLASTPSTSSITSNQTTQTKSSTQRNNNGQVETKASNETNQQQQPTSSTTEISLLGVPRSPGLLKITGYSCVVFDMENRCYLQPQQAIVGQSKQDLSVQVLPALPKLQVQTSLKRAPVVDDEGGVGEATIFSGQTAVHTITMQNTDKRTAIRWIKCRVVDQPTGFGGPPLVELLADENKDESDDEENKELNSTDSNDTKQQKPSSKLTQKNINGLQFGRLKPGKDREIRLKIFGVDPASQSAQSAQETQVFVRKHQRANTAAALMDSEQRLKIEKSKRSKTDLGSLMEQNEEKYTDEEEPDEDQQLLERNNSIVSAPDLTTKLSPHSTHDLIPYTGRLLTAVVEFTYAADIETESGESYERSERLSLAVSIVPALTVLEWQVIAGDSPSTRFVVVDVTNLCDSEAELTFGADQRMINVQSRELCRVPLLCPCSAEIHAADFQQAAQRASHMMQMQEMEQLRRRLEKHISTHLEIRWKIAALELEGLVPVGPLLASVSFLKQLVVPSLSVSIEINNKPYKGEGDVVAGIGEMLRMRVRMECVASSNTSALPPALTNSPSLASKSVQFQGEMALKCFQDLQNGKPVVDRMENLVVCGVKRRQFNLKMDPNNSSSQYSTSTSFTYTFFFRTEGIYKLRPEVQAKRNHQPIQLDELFVPNVSFNVVTKLVSSSGPSVSNNKN